jgi:hypothetical protein
MRIVRLYIEKTKHIGAFSRLRRLIGILSDWRAKAMTYKYKFTCEYTKSVQTFEETIEYDHEPSEDELEEDYNDWLSRYVVGGWEHGNNDD